MAVLKTLTKSNGEQFVLTGDAAFFGDIPLVELAEKALAEYRKMPWDRRGIDDFALDTSALTDAQRISISSDVPLPKVIQSLSTLGYLNPTGREHGAANNFFTNVVYSFDDPDPMHNGIFFYTNEVPDDDIDTALEALSDLKELIKTLFKLDGKE